MTKSELILIKSALQHVVTMRVNTVNALPNAPFNTSTSFSENVQNLIRERKERNIRHIPTKRVVAIAIIAAIILSLVACVIYREEIKGFFVESFEKNLKLSSTDDSNTFEIKQYAPTYMPKEYHLTNESYYNDRIQKSWSNGNSQIILRQTIKNSNTLTIDTEDGSYILKTLDELQLHCVQKNSLYVITWGLNDCIFTLRCPDDIPWSEIEAIILSLEPIESEN